MKILSLFDGISCARVALERAGINVERYFASEIDKYAIQISSKNYPDIIQIGDVKMVAHKDAPIHYKLNDIDLIIGGSPCQDLSIAKRDRKGLDGERSGLFWEYVRILNEVKPNYFILENVASMPKEARDLISKTLGVEPIMINASLVSAQNRKRLFWVSSRLDLCYNCKYEQLLKEIQHKGEVTEAQRAGVKKLLQEQSKEKNRLQDLQQEVFSSVLNSKMLLQRVYEYQQKAERQENNSKEEKLPKDILREKKERITRIWKELSPEQQRDFSEILQKIHFQTRSQNEESTKRGVEEKQKNYQYDWERGIVGYVEKDKHGVCFLRFYGGLDGRPYNPSEQGWNERFGELTATMSELQFIQERQANQCSCCGGITPVNYEQVVIPQPEDKHIYLKDIIIDGIAERDKSLCVTATYSRACPADYFDKHSRQLIKLGHFNKGGQGDRVYSIEGKSATLSALGGGRGAKTGLYLVSALSQRGRHLVDGKRKDILGAKTEQRFELGGDKAHTLTSVTKDNLVADGDIYRKLHPIECERLQGLPDNFTEGISNSQRYKCLGNAFNVDVVSHILRFIKL